MANPEGSYKIPPSPDNRVKIPDYSSYYVRVEASSPGIETTLIGPENEIFPTEFYPDALVVGNGRRIMRIWHKKQLEDEENPGNFYITHAFPFGENTLQCLGEAAGGLFAVDEFTHIQHRGNFGFGQTVDSWNASIPPGAREFQLYVENFPSFGWDQPVQFSGNSQFGAVSFTPNPAVWDAKKGYLNNDEYQHGYPIVIGRLAVPPPVGSHFFDVTATSFDDIDNRTVVHSTACNVRVTQTAEDADYGNPDGSVPDVPEFEIVPQQFFIQPQTRSASSALVYLKIKINGPTIFADEPRYPPVTVDDVDYLNATYPCAVNFCTTNYVPNPLPDPPPQCSITVPFLSGILFGGGNWPFQVVCRAPSNGWDHPNGRVVGSFPYAVQVSATLNGYSYSKWFELWEYGSI